MTYNMEVVTMMIAAGSNGTLILTPEATMDYFYLGVICKKHKCESRWLDGNVKGISLTIDNLITALSANDDI